MGKCKNVECKNETIGNNVYCSLKCRNYYVNKFIRDYSKNGIGLSKEVNYKTTPKYCQNLECGKKLEYNIRRNKYCNSSCQAKVTNLGRVLTQETKDKIKISNTRNENELKTIQCKNCGLKVLIKERKKFCSLTCKNINSRVGVDEYLNYKQDTKFKFSLNDFPDEFEFSLIEKHGWYSPSNSKRPNIGGISRDHMLSVREGFNLGIDSKLLSHPANCQLMIHNKNISKNKKSSLTIEELKNRILEWDKKYKL